MADGEHTKTPGDRTHEIATVSFRDRVIRTIIAGDLSRLSFLYQTDAIGPEDFVVALRERLHAIDSLLHNVQVRRRLADAEALSWSDTLHALGVETAEAVEPTRCEVLCQDLLGSGATLGARHGDPEGSEKARSGLYSSTKSPGLAFSEPTDPQERREKEEARKREERTSGSVSSPGASETETENPPGQSETVTVTETEEGPCPAHAQKGLEESDRTHPDSDSQSASDSGADSASDSDSGGARGSSDPVSDSSQACGTPALGGDSRNSPAGGGWATAQRSFA